MKSILITGAAGSIGSALARKLAGTCKLYVLDSNESGLFDLCQEIKSEPIICDIRDREAVNQAVDRIRPAIVYHVAAYKHVPLMEKHPMEAVKTNIGGTLNIAFASIKYKVKKFVLVSTDKAVEPTSVMGWTKLFGERICDVANFGPTKFVVVRFGNVMASRGSVIPIWQKQIAKGEALTVTSKEMTRFFMGIYDAVELIIKASNMAKGGEIFIFDMGDEINVYDLAKLVLKLYGVNLPIKLIGTRIGEKKGEMLYNPQTHLLIGRGNKIYEVKEKRS